MKKLTKRSLIAIITVALVLVVLGTATYAWITINNLASVRGMRMEIDTTDSLQIEEELEIVEENFTNRIVNPANGQVKYLQPVSSSDGKTFYYTPNILTGVDGSGRLNDNAHIYEYDPDDFASLYENVYTDIYEAGYKVQGYAEYTFIIKATAAGDNVKVYLTNIELECTDSNVENKTFRVAVLTKELGADGKFGNQEYNTIGIISTKENDTSRSIKNNQEYLAFGKTTAGDIRVSDTETIKQYRTNYGTYIYSEDGVNFYTDALKSTPYELKLATSADARLQLGQVTTLRQAEKVVSVSYTVEHGKYKFETNQGNIVYGDSQESANNASYYYWGLKPFEFDDTLNEEVVEDEGIDTQDGYFSFTTTQGNNVFGLSKDKADNTEYYYKDTNDQFVYTLRPYVMLDNAEELVIPASPKEVTLLNGNKYYEFTTSDARKVYSVSATGEAPLFSGEFVDEQEAVKNSYLDVVDDYKSTDAILTLNAGEVGYVLVTLRIWIEGEDQDCNNQTYVKLGKDYEMNVDFGLTAPDEVYLKLK